MAGGEAWLVFCAWRYGQEDPWATFNCLDRDYRRPWNPEMEPLRPKHPDRLQRFLYALGKAAAIVDGKMEDTKPAPKRPRPSRVVLPPGVEPG